MEELKKIEGEPEGTPLKPSQFPAQPLEFKGNTFKDPESGETLYQPEEAEFDQGYNDAVLKQWEFHHDAVDQEVTLNLNRLQDYVMKKEATSNPNYDAGFKKGWADYPELAKNPNELYNRVLGIRKEKQEPNILGRLR